MRQYDDDTIYDELNQLGADDYSFLIHSKIDAMREPVGYCIAYEAKSETDPNFDGTTVYVADFGIIPEARGGAIAMRGFRELLERLDARGIKKVEMDAREKTTYALLTSELMQRHLERKGWKVVEHDIDTDFGEGERTIMLSLERE
jgi:ribosomal protein S18 acetylase RimI-like enzyme